MFWVGIWLFRLEGSRGAHFACVKMKYVIVTGGVVSGLGKGVTASSIGVVLKACGLRVTSIKIGTRIVESGEDFGCFVTWGLGVGAGFRV